LSRVLLVLVDGLFYINLVLIGDLNLLSRGLATDVGFGEIRGDLMSTLGDANIF
jgi:hypothetical protein